MKKVLVAFAVLVSSVGHAGVKAGEAYDEGGRNLRALAVKVESSPFTRVQSTTDVNGNFFEKTKAKLVNEVEKIKVDMQAKEKAEKLAKELLHESCFLQYGGSLLDSSLNVKSSNVKQEESTVSDTQQGTKQMTVSSYGIAEAEAICEVGLFNAKDLVKEIWKGLIN